MNNIIIKTNDFCIRLVIVRLNLALILGPPNNQYIQSELPVV